MCPRLLASTLYLARTLTIALYIPHSAVLAPNMLASLHHVQWVFSGLVRLYLPLCCSRTCHLHPLNACLLCNSSCCVLTFSRKDERFDPRNPGQHLRLQSHVPYKSYSWPIPRIAQWIAQLSSTWYSLVFK